MDWLGDPQIWAALVTLTALEIVLGVDNLIFISVMAERLPPYRRKTARGVGLALALVTRLTLLALAAWLTRLTTPIGAAAHRARCSPAQGGIHGKKARCSAHHAGFD